VKLSETVGAEESERHSYKCG